MLLDNKLEGEHGSTVATPAKACDVRAHCTPPVAESGREGGLRPHIGEIVDVRSAEEILATLDSEGRFEGVPFMPEMLRFCGGRFEVFKYADLTCTDGEPRCLTDTLHLNDLRCDGSAHRNCEAKCLVFWKEAWIRRIAPDDASAGISSGGQQQGAASLPKNVAAFLKAHVERNDGTMSCQATEIRSASCPLGSGLSNYLGNVYRDFRAQRIGWPDLWRLLLWIRGRMLWSAYVWWAGAPWNAGRYSRTPSRTLNLQAGEFVKVRSAWHILRSLDHRGRNRGLRFTPEMFRYCGKKYRVLARMERRINERDGQLVEFGNSCVLLENAVCHGQRMFCTRTEYHYWREIWLDRV